MSRIGYMILMTLLLCCCADDSFRGLSDSLGGGDSQPIPVVVALGNPGVDIVKGTGAVEGIEDWVEAPIYVYAFSRDDEGSYAAMSWSEPLKCLVDASMDVPGSLGGKKAHVDMTRSYAVWENENTRLYYPSEDDMKHGYDFFAYYIDDIVPSKNEIMRYDDRVDICLSIDGSHDIMSAKASLTQNQLAAFTDRDKALIQENAFSYYTAQRNVLPTFFFRHHLVRLEFELVAGLLRDEQKNVAVHKLEVRSRNQAVLTVAAKDDSRLGMIFYPSMANLALTREDGSPLDPYEYVVQTRPFEDVVRDNIKFGGCLLVSPEDEYEAWLTLSETRLDGSVVIENVRTPLTVSYTDGGFGAGNQYKVKLTIYGATKVAASVEMEQWRDGGRIEMDMENDKPII